MPLQITCCLRSWDGGIRRSQYFGNPDQTSPASYKQPFHPRNIEAYGDTESDPYIPLYPLPPPHAPTSLKWA